MVPPARMWDSKGAEAGLSRAEDRIGETDQARVGEVGLSVSKGTLTAAADASFLDDPATVYPVVIDPAVSMSQTYVVRVTETFRTINDMSVDAKLGYNGWTSPYYKSRMFYQFKWPLYSGTMIAAVQVQRVAHAFGAGFPVADAGPGKVALWTGELSVDDTDAELTTPTGELSISRVHNSFAGPAIGVQNQVFGPGWTPSLDAAGGFSGAELVDGTATDATLSLIDADGSTLRWQTSTKKRRTTVALPTAAYTPLDKATKTAGVTIAVTNSGNLPTVKLTDEDGVETTFVGVAAPAVKTDQVVFKATGVKDKATNETSTLAYDGAGRVSAIVAALPDGVSSCAPGTPAKGCRVLKLSYTSGGLLETVKAQVNLDADRTLASYSYDGQGRLATVTDSRPGLVTSYL